MSIHIFCYHCKRVREKKLRLQDKQRRKTLAGSGVQLAFLPYSNFKMNFVYSNRNVFPELMFLQSVSLGCNWHLTFTKRTGANKENASGENLPALNEMWKQRKNNTTIA